MEANIDSRIEAAQRAVAEAEALLITAGAGMGVDSGLPDFRGTQGFWRSYPAIAKMGLSFEEMANPEWFQRDPALAWAFYGHRLQLYRATVPHAGFRKLSQLGKSKRDGCFVFTSNVDGQFQKAGFNPESLVECHGSIHHFQCVANCTRNIWDAGNETVTIDESHFRAVEPLPRCPHCGALARPNILMFGDWSWLGWRTEQQENRFQNWLERLAGKNARLAVVELGAGSAIPTVRLLSEQVAGKRPSHLIRINLREPQVPPGQIGLPLSAAEGIGLICDPAAA